MSHQYQLIVIGAGPGGYVAAIRGAQLGMKVAIVEKLKTLGGTCLNWGCIPSKALLDSSEHYHQATKKFAIHGIQTTGLSVDIKQMMKRKQDVVDNTTAGIDFLMKKNNIERIEGIGSLKDAHTVTIQNEKETHSITADNILIATGSEVTPLPTVPMDGKRIISSTEALSLQEVPKSLIVIGGGVIGVELGSVYARLGTDVTIVEYMDGLIPTMDKELGKTLLRSMKKLGVTCKFNTKVVEAKTASKSVTLKAETKKGDITLEAEYVLVAIGRRPYTDALNLEAVDIQTDSRGRISVNKNFQTSCPSIYAIGDVIAGPMLAHKASEEGVACVEIMAGKAGHLNYHTIPGVVYTWPEVASVGYTEEELQENNREYNCGKFTFKASGRARASEESEGFIKVLADKTTDEIIGVHMIGPRVSDMIAQAVTAMEYKASAEDIGIMIAAHPTFSEAFKEAALDVHNNAIHS